MERYTYRPLRPAPNSTRLLQIAPGVKGSDITCQLIDHTIQQGRISSPYEGLSYAWGDPTKRRRIWLRDAEAGESEQQPLSFLDITTNLYAALDRLRDTAFPRLLWVDALCIDQENVQERAVQVRSMAMIYIYASRVVVWLGEEADNSTMALASIERAAQDRRRFLSTNKFTPKVDAPDTQLITVEAQEAIFILLKRPWFHRIWVLQEVAAARCLSIICGDAEVTGTTFVLGLPLYLGLRDSTMWNLGASIMHMMTWETPLINTPHSGSVSQDTPATLTLDILPLGELVEKFHLHQASDTRDKVFALLGMCQRDGTTTDHLQPDYSETWATVFKYLINHILGRGNLVSTWEDREQAVITGQGCPLARVVAVNSEEVRVKSFHFSGPRGCGNTWEASWPARTYCKSIKEGDILWQMERAASPSLIRFCEDHFDIIVVSVPLETIVAANGTQIWRIPWQKHRHAIANARRQVTLVWDWKPLQLQLNEGHAILLRGSDAHISMDPAGIPLVVTCARIFDDLCDRGGIISLLTQTQEPSRNAKVRRYWQALQIAIAHWASYVWMKTHIEELRWCISTLQAEHQHGTADIDQLLSYWTDEGCLPLAALEILNLSSTCLRQTLSSACADPLDSKFMYWDFGEPEHATLIDAFFPGYTNDWTEPSDMIHRARKWNGRYLTRIMLAHKNVEQVALRVPTLVGSSPEQKSLFVILNRKLITYALLSESLNNMITLSRKELETLAQDPNAAPIFSFLLAESYQDLPSIYNILSVAVANRLQFFSDLGRTGAVTVSGPASSTAAWSTVYCHFMAPWFYDNILVLHAYITHTSLCDFARLGPSEALNALLAVFCPHDISIIAEPSNPIYFRTLILAGMHEFFAEQEQIDRMTGFCALEEGPRSRSFSKKWYGVQALRRWDEYAWCGNYLKRKGRVRVVVETCMAGLLRAHNAQNTGEDFKSLAE